MYKKSFKSFLIPIIAALTFSTSFLGVNQSIEFKQEKSTNARKETDNGFKINFNNLLENYTTNLISLDISVNNGKIDNFYIKGGIINNSVKDEDSISLNISIEITDENAELTIDAIDIDGIERSDSIYFVKDDSNIFTSKTSLNQAKISVARDKLSKNLINNEEFKHYKELVYEKSLSNNLVTLKDSSNIKLDAQIKWEDLYSVEHPLAYTYVELQKRTYIGSSYDYPYFDQSVAYGYTDKNGQINFDYTNTDTLYDKFGYYIRVYAQGVNTKVVDNTEESVYYWNSEIANGLTNGELYYRPVIDMTTDLGKAFQVSQAIIYGAKYANVLNGGTDISDCTLILDDEGAYYMPSSREIHIDFLANEDGNYVTRPKGYEDWDVILHEYSHHIQNYFGNIDNSPGGSHYINTNNADDRVNGTPTSSNKINGINLAWGEGWATYNGQMIQDYFSDEISTVKYTCDSEYNASNGVQYSLLDYGYKGATPKGEANECAISQILYKLADSRTDEYDNFGYGDTFLWKLVKNNSIKTFSQFNTKLNNSVSEATMFKLGKLYARYSISPTNLVLSYGNFIDALPTFEWTGNGGSKYFSNDTFSLTFKNESNVTLFTQSSIKDTKYTLTKSQWDLVRNSPGNSYYVYIKGSANAYYSTGPYYSELFNFAKPTEFLTKYQITPADYGFWESYVTSEVSQSVTVGDLSFNTTRYRCGYIEEEYINLSPRRGDYRKAYLEYEFSKPVYRVEVAMAFWIDDERYDATGNSAIAEFNYKNINQGSWDDHSINLLDKNLPEDRTKPITLIFDIPEGTKEFRFYAEFLTVSGTVDRNKGRICIGNMIVTTEA